MVANIQLDNLIEVFYDSALDSKRFCEALQQTAKHIEADNVIFITLDKATNEPDYSFSHWVETKPQSLPQNQHKFSNVECDLLLALLDNVQIGECKSGKFSLTNHIKNNRIDESHVFGNSNTHVIATWVTEDETDRHLLAAIRSGFRPPFSDDQINNFKRICFHLKNALYQQKYINRLNLRAELNEKAINSLELPTLFVDSNCSLQHANHTAIQMLNRPDFDLIIDEKGLLSVNDLNYKKQLTETISRVFDKKIPLSGTTLGENKKLQLWLKYVNVRKNIPLVLILAIAPKETDDSLRVFGEMYRLTSSELKLLEALMRGKTINEYAKTAHLSLSTVRSHLKSILNKTITNRQVELLALLYRVPVFLSGLLMIKNYVQVGFGYF